MRYLTVALLSAIMLVGCGKKTPEGLKLGAISEGSPGHADVPEIVLVDFDQNPPKQYRMTVGDTQDGIEVVRADYSKKTVFIRRDGQESSLTISE